MNIQRAIIGGLKMLEQHVRGNRKSSDFSNLTLVASPAQLNRMTTEEFYASALIAALPHAQTEAEPAGEHERMVTEIAHQYADALTRVFEQNRRNYRPKGG